MKVKYLRDLPCRVGDRIPLIDLRDGEIGKYGGTLFYKIENDIIFVYKRSYDSWIKSDLNDRVRWNIYLSNCSVVVHENTYES
jgi:hypothetical protein